MLFFCLIIEIRCVSKVFPDEFHLSTLSMFLKSCEELHPGVNVKNIIILMIDRLANYTQNNQDTESLQLFDIFSDQVASILQVSVCL